MMSVRESPRKNPTSSVTLRSGATPQKSQGTPTNPKNTYSFAGADSSPEILSDYRNCSPEQLKLSMIDGNSRSPTSVHGKTPIREPVVVLRRQESPDVNAASRVLLTSPAKSPMKYPHGKLPTSPVATRAGVIKSAEQITSPAKRGRPSKIAYIDADVSADNKSAEQIPSPVKRGRPRKTHGPDENGLGACEMRSELNLCRNASSERPLESSATLTAEDIGVSGHRRGRRPPIVIVLEDFECFSSQLLQDLITICG